MHALRLARRLVVTGLTAALTLAVAWAGVGLAPAGQDDATTRVTPPDGGMLLEGGSQPASLPAPPDESLVMAGAAKVSIEPDPEAYDAHWETEDCEPDARHATDLRTPWPVNPDCIYIWGIGPGPVPVVGWDDEYGLWARSVAVSDGTQMVVLTILDAFYWFGYYDSFCEGCGGVELAEELAATHGFDPAGFFLASTHSHAAPDFIGSGGGAPEWYFEQVADAIRASVATAIENMAPAVIEMGEALARDLNRQRRSTYWSAEEAGLAWFRAIGVDEEGAPDPDGVIATVGAYAAHPVSWGDNDGIAHADWPALFNARLEDRFGEDSVGLFFQSGLGQMRTRSIGDGTRQVGVHLANRIPEVGGGTIVSDPRIQAARRLWNHPITNIAVGGTLAAGVFDRRLEGPAAVSVPTGLSGLTQCAAAAPTSARTVVSAARIGSLTITGGPGELFANITNTIKSQAPDGITLPLSLINDGLGYIMQDFENVSAYGTPLVIEYEEVFGTKCLGDAVLEYTIELMSDLGIPEGRSGRPADWQP